jgi:pyridoxal phosphate enzyme (YggS family)
MGNPSKTTPGTDDDCDGQIDDDVVLVGGFSKAYSSLLAFIACPTEVKDLLKVPNLYAVHTVDTLKLAQELQKRAAALRPPEQRLRVFVQVNTSGEESKSGCAPADCPALCRAVRSSCAALDLIGLMCIGKYSAEEGGSDVDFACLRQCRVAVAGALGLGIPEELAMSMGMSHDFEDALTAGASHVRVGSTIFGARAPKPTAKSTQAT